MNFIGNVILLGLVTLCLAKYTEKQNQFTADVYAKCAIELAMVIDSDFIERSKITGNVFTNDEASKKLLACWYTQAGMIDSDGNIRVQALVDYLSEGRDVQALTDVVEKCATVDGDTVEDKAYNFEQCFWKELTFEL
ncbi:uncharacterized protein LOC131428424 [Malaya genurostris]|uniref:uncharacterized protein LOC131428424 n=1 Tax=Malaya genurostris TaxID=325434 RepID=UPI0026F3DEAA|nr:uncharacterized protein LOC131428424 [Malaya genurostris]